MNRRLFLMASGGAALAQSPADRISLGVIGLGGRGRNVALEFRKDPALAVRALCDVYEPRLEAALSQFGPGVAAYRDYRRLLDDPEVDVVLIATPEHWHHRMTLDALAAGKDIYVEKPLCHTPEEGKELVEAVRASDRIVQVGMQRRSYDLYQQARDLRRQGRLGTVRMVRSYWLNHMLEPRRQRFEGAIDWPQWLGPAAGAAAPNPLHFFNWRHLSRYAGGIVIDQGAHIYDAIHMILDLGYPSAVNASACSGHVEGVDQPESVVVVAEYPEEVLAVFTINYAAMKYPPPIDQLNSYDGDAARMDVGREFVRIYDQADPATPAVAREDPGGFGSATTAHVANFLECVRTRQEPTAPIEKGFQAALVLQLANRSLEQGRRIRWDRERLTAA